MHRISWRTCLDVGLRQRNHLGENVGHLQVLHLIPLPSSLINTKISWCICGVVCTNATRNHFRNIWLQPTWCRTCILYAPSVGFPSCTTLATRSYVVYFSVTWASSVRYSRRSTFLLRQIQIDNMNKCIFILEDKKYTRPWHHFSPELHCNNHSLPSSASTSWFCQKLWSMLRISSYGVWTALTWWGSWQLWDSFPQRSCSWWIFWCKRRGTEAVWSAGTFWENSLCRFCTPEWKLDRKACTDI